jgi:BASS family bile acid:Na+ symporter
LGSARGQDPGAVALSLVATVVGPVVAGHLFCRWVRALEVPLRTIAPWVANVVILWIIAAVVGLNRGPLAESGGRGMLLSALLAINVGGYLVGYYGGASLRLPESMRRALTIEVGMQNAGVGTFLATQFFADPETAIPPAVYTFGCMLTGTVLAQWWAKRLPVDAGDADVAGGT